VSSETAEPLVVGFDLGSSAAKVVVATTSGVVMARASRPQSVDRGAAGLVEQDPENWWAALCQLVMAAFGSFPDARRHQIAAVAISGHFPTLLIADGAGRPLAPAMLYADARAEGHVRQAGDLAGQQLLGDEILPKLLWLRANSPSSLRHVRRIFNPQDYLVFRLTGSHVLDHHTASRLGGLLDMSRLAWRADVMAAAGLSIDVLPDLRRPGDVAGTVSEAAAMLTRIPEGTPVITGVGDTLAALLGAGVVRSHQVLLYYGTTATADVCTRDIESYLVDPTLLAQGAPYREVAYALLGPVLSWAAAGFDAGNSGHSVEALDEAAGALGTRVDAPYVLPFFVERPRSGAIANRPGIIGLDLGQGRPELHRALLESFGYAVRAGLEDGGFEVPLGAHFVAAGGGASSRTWRQIVSDVLDAEQRWHPGADGALGDAMLAAWSTGRCDTFGGGLASWRGQAEVTVADPAAAAVQRRRYPVWRRLATGVADAFRPPESQT
jgi:xylulokinase